MPRLSVPPPPSRIPEGDDLHRPRLVVPQAVFRFSNVPSPGPHFRSWTEVALAANLANNAAKEALPSLYGEDIHQNFYAWKVYLLHGAMRAGLPELQYDRRQAVLYWPTPYGQFSYHVGMIRRPAKGIGPAYHTYKMPYEELMELHADNVVWHEDIMQPRARELWLELLRDRESGGLGAAPVQAFPPFHLSGLRCGSLFSGGGGWEEGAKFVGVSPIWGVELDAGAAAGWAANNTGLGVQIHVADLQTIDPHGLPRIDILFTSPPCQGYSKARKKSLQARCDLSVGLDTLRYVGMLTPRVVMLEEVPAYESSPILKKLKAGMARLGYTEHAAILKAQDHGLPSRRERLYVVWTRGVAFDFGKLPVGARSWDQALAGLYLPPGEPPSPGQQRSLAARPVTRWPTLLSASWKVGQKGSTSIFHTDAGRVGPPITKSYEGMAGWRVLHADGKVDRFTPRAAARLMGFPDSYQLPASPAAAFGVVGNAVAPPMSAALLRCLG